ncbi:MAG: hypothetical protein KatS3mg004_3730 [Bryobacteraceae bacterium]|nr:MAG: hypothetical protein KatS3mg004_3730 [Bryobacteraceae bacterium]
MLLLACPALSQMVYNISVYNDATTDGVTLYAVSTTVDNSTGCQAHGSYSTTTRIIAPDGSQTFSTSSGMIANASMPINGRTGDFTVMGSVQLYCGCFMHWVGGSGPARAVGVAIAYTGFQSLEIRYDANGRAYCHYKDLFCREGTIPTCVTGDYTESNTPVPPCPSQIHVSWLRVTFAGWQKCFAVSWVGITLPAYCQ